MLPWSRHTSWREMRAQAFSRTLISPQSTQGNSNLLSPDVTDYIDLKFSQKSA
jgi:glucose-6-phosphate dehydrogenase assembly protein OpcA